MLDGRAVRERQLIQMKRADGVHKWAYHLSNWLIKCRAAHPFLFGFKPERPCFEKVSCGHQILGKLSLFGVRHHTVGPLHLSSLLQGTFPFTIAPATLTTEHLPHIAN